MSKIVNMGKLPALNQKVKFCRIQNGEAGKPDELIRGEGTVVGLIIGTNRRPNVMVKDSETSLNKAWTLEPMCIDPTELKVQDYFQHRQNLNGVVKEFNDKAIAVIDEGNRAVDALNERLFGKPLDI